MSVVIGNIIIHHGQYCKVVPAIPIMITLVNGSSKPILVYEIRGINKSIVISKDLFEWYKEGFFGCYLFSVDSKSAVYRFK